MSSSLDSTQAPAATASREGAGGPPAPGAPAGLQVVVVIPALNEQETIGTVVEGLPRSIPGVDRIQVVVVDDGSTDLTGERATAAGAHVVRNAGNRGLVAAFNRGTTEALARGADIVVMLDADGQHDAGAMPRIVAPIVGGNADVVVAVRPLADPSQGSPVRRVGNRVGSSVVRALLSVPVSDVTSGYRAFSREALTQLHVNGGYTHTLETLIQAAGKRLRVEEVVVRAHRRTVGTSRMTHSIVRYVGRTSNQAFRTALHTQPLRVFGRLAAGFGAGAVAVTAWFLIAYAQGGQHLPSLLAAVLLAVCAAALLICGLLADGISANRRLLEDTLHRIKQMEAAGAEDRRTSRALVALPAPVLVADHAERPAA